MNIKRNCLAQYSFVALVAALISQGSIAHAQLESPIIMGEILTAMPPETKRLNGKIKPLFWEANIGTSALFIPLKEIEFVSVQNYKVVSSILQPGRDVIAEKSEMTRVRELTISTKSQSFIRIYFIDKLKDTGKKEGDQSLALKEMEAVKELEKLRGKLDTVEEQPYPVKHYPETTHKHMVEYRVANENDVVELYENLQQTLIDFHAYQLVDDQKPETVSTVSASENK